MTKVVPVLTVIVALVLIWYAAAVGMNAQWARDQAARAETTLGFGELVVDTWSQDRPVLPAPHQVAQGLYDSVLAIKPTSKRSLVYHGWITLSATLAGFGIGTLAGIALAVGIVHSRAMDMSVMPWAIASQTIPILAIAPMIIVVLNSIGISGLLPKAIISAYLSFFPVVVGMVKGLRAPDAMQLDQMRTWSATNSQTFWRLRLPSSMPYLFASLKVAIAAALVGTIVAELPAGATRGLGARLLSGSYYGQTVQIWSALFAAAALAAALVVIVGLIERGVLKRMGMAQ
ncbi:Putative aliphatic sulfonates transport permease protein SsuC [Aquimixticola soesokkakensis]|uniref:Putative aliphatic sulfonates transport permease protein SsuC n=1 Tax=Aquimixticola soesokkakensis TaxID=1519096 RepID=A0A1Y5TA63_9RHOB|nr:ABC transporter permease [Aquimixticola soesokkakensis]SLN57468.1 Putative aliphatic sulfonates transport permease protein SsuC [Aquimixticola soesokkakensis]